MSVDREKDMTRATEAYARKRVALEALAVEINTGLVGDEECAVRLAEIGATDEELEEVMGW